MAFPAVASVRDLLDQVANDQSLTAAQRAASLRSLRDDLSTLLGQADMYLGDQELQREGAAISRVGELVRARENADVRDDLLARSVATPEQLDAAGFLSHEELDDRERDGTLEEALAYVKVKDRDFWVPDSEPVEPLPFRERELADSDNEGAEDV